MITEQVDNFLHLNKKEEENPKQVQDINRQHGETILSILQGIDFTKNRIENPEDPEFQEAMKIMRDKLVSKLDKENTLSDDLTVIDAKLEYIANAWASAVSEGFYNKAKWAMTALNKGIKDIRTNVPSDQAHRADAVLEARAKRVDVYINLVKSSEAIDTAERAIAAATVQIKNNQKELEPIRDEVVAARQDPKKLEMLAKIKGVQLGRLKGTDLNDEESQLRARLEKGISLAKNIDMLRNNIAKSNVDLNTARNLFNANYTSLTMNDQPEFQELIAGYKEILNSTVKATEEALIYANKVREEYLVFTKQMEAVWDSTEGQNLLNDVVDFVEQNLSGDKMANVLDIARRMMEDVGAEAKRQLEAEDELQSIMAETNINTNGNKNINYNT